MKTIFQLTNSPTRGMLSPATYPQPIKLQSDSKQSAKLSQQFVHISQAEIIKNT